MPYEIAEQTISIPLKYLIKVGDEAKEPKFKVGDLALQSNEKVRIAEIRDNGDIIAYTEDSYRVAGRECDFGPYVYAEDKKRGSIIIPVEADLTDGFWTAYTADLAKEVTLKVANKFNTPPRGSRRVCRQGCKSGCGGA